MSATTESADVPVPGKHTDQERTRRVSAVDPGTQTNGPSLVTYATQVARRQPRRAVTEDPVAMANEI